MGLTNFTYERLIPALCSCGLTLDEIVANKNVQEVAYLLERAGFGLGYRYKWELFGPFSPELADEVRSIDKSLVSTSVDGAGLDKDVVRRIIGLMARPEHVDVADDEWLRLLVCVDFVESRVPGITTDGSTPAYISLNFTRDAIDAARSEVQALTL